MNKNNKKNNMDKKEKIKKIWSNINYKTEQQIRKDFFYKSLGVYVATSIFLYFNIKMQYKQVLIVCMALILYIGFTLLNMLYTYKKKKMTFSNKDKFSFLLYITNMALLLYRLTLLKLWIYAL